MQIIKIENINSTNLYSSELLKNNEITEDTVIYTDYQTSGRGLGKNIWNSEKDKNLLFSLITFPNIKVEDHFKLNIIISLSICEYLQIKGVLAKIKWPNDIYVNSNKIAGILVENTFYRDVIQSSVIGVGLNLNQQVFPDNLPNPISLSQIANMDFNIEKEIKEISKILSSNLNDYKELNISELKKEYLIRLYRFNEFYDYKISDKIVTAKITDIKNDGHIVVTDRDGNQSSYYFKEIEYVL